MGSDARPAKRQRQPAQSTQRAGESLQRGKSSGIGDANLVRIPAGGDRFAMDVAALDAAIRADRDAGYRPAAIVACLGGTSIGACDDIAGLAAVARRHGIYLHVDAAWAGSAMICPEFRHLMAGAELADSFVLNPHKWLFTPMDCSVLWVRRAEVVRRAFALVLAIVGRMVGR